MDDFYVLLLFLLNVECSPPALWAAAVCWVCNTAQVLGHREVLVWLSGFPTTHMPVPIPELAC